MERKWIKQCSCMPFYRASLSPMCLIMFLFFIFTLLPGLGNNISSSFTHHLGDVERAVCLFSDGDGSIHSLCLHLVSRKHSQWIIPHWCNSWQRSICLLKMREMCYRDCVCLSSPLLWQDEIKVLNGPMFVNMNKMVFDSPSRIAEMDAIFWGAYNLSKWIQIFRILEPWHLCNFMTTCIKHSYATNMSTAIIGSNYISVLSGFYICVLMRNEVKTWDIHW